MLHILPTKLFRKIRLKVCPTLSNVSLRLKYFKVVQGHVHGAPADEQSVSDVSQILTRSIGETYMGLSYAKEIVSMSSAV